MSTMSREQIFSSQAVDATDVVEATIDMFNEGMASEGDITLQSRVVAGTGTRAVKVEALVSVDSINYVLEDPPIVANWVAADNDDNWHIDVALVAKAPKLKIRPTGLAGAGSVVDMWICY